MGPSRPHLTGGAGGGTLNAGLAASQALLQGLQPSGQRLHPLGVLLPHGARLRLQAPQLGPLLLPGSAVRQRQRPAGTASPRGTGTGLLGQGLRFWGVHKGIVLLGCAQRD